MRLQARISTSELPRPDFWHFMAINDNLMYVTKASSAAAAHIMGALRVNSCAAVRACKLLAMPWKNGEGQSARVARNETDARLLARCF